MATTKRMNINALYALNAQLYERDYLALKCGGAEMPLQAPTHKPSVGGSTYASIVRRTLVELPPQTSVVPHVEVPSSHKRTRVKLSQMYDFLTYTNRITSRVGRPGTTFQLYCKKQPLLHRRERHLSVLKKLASVPWTPADRSFVPRDDIPRGEVRATSHKQIKVRADRTTYTHEEYRETPEMEFIEKTTKQRNAVLLLRLRMKIILLKSRRCPGNERLTHFARTMQKVQNNMPELYKQAEAQGWFNVELGAKTHKTIEGIVDKITDSVKSVSDAMTSKVVVNISAVAGIMVTAASANNKVSWVTGILSSLAVTSIINWDTMINTVTRMTPAITTKPESASDSTGVANANFEEVQDAENTVTCASALTVLFQGIGTYCGITSDFERNDTTLKDWAKIITKNLQFNARSTSGMFSFFRHFIYIIKSMVKWCYSKLNPELAPLINFWEHSAILRAIFNEATKLKLLDLHEYQDVNNMARLDATIVLLNEIIVRISGFDVKSNGVVLLNSCVQLRKELTDKRLECNKIGVSSVTTIPPYCVYFTGKTGIGKSTLLNDLAFDLQDECEITEHARGRIYTRRPGLKYWDGYTNQEMIVYDDFAQFNQTDPDNTDVQEIFQLITDQPFRPNCAEINNKGRISVVKMVLIAANEAFPKRNYLMCNEALWRRRNQLIDVSLKAGHKNPSMNTPHDPTYAHLTFRIRTNVSSITDEAYSDNMSYDELKLILKKDAKEYMEAQKSRVNHRLQQLQLPLRTQDQAPLTPEMLEKALTDTLLSRPEISPWSKIYNISNHVQQVKQWLRSYMPFLFQEPEILAEATSEIDDMIEKDLIVKDLTQAALDEHTIIMYLAHDTTVWDAATPQRKKEVYEYFKSHFDENMPFPHDYDPATGVCTPRATDETGDGQVEEPKVGISPDCKAKVEQKEKELAEAKYNAALNRADSAKAKDGFVHTPFTVLDCNNFHLFPSEIKPFLSYFITFWSYGGKVIPVEDFARTITNLNNTTCKHTLIDLNQPHHVLEFAAVFRRKNSQVFGNFPFYACGKTCVFRQGSALRLLQLYHPTIYKGIEEFSKLEPRHKQLKISSDDILLKHISLFKKIRNWVVSAYTKYTKKIPRPMQWLWTLLKWLLYLIVPIGVILTAIFGYKAWKTTDKESGYVDKFKEIPGHVKQQFAHAYASKGRSVFNPYHGITEGDAAYTIAARQPGGTTIQEQHLGAGHYGDMTHLIRIFTQASTFIKGYANLRSTGEATTFNFRVFQICGNYIMMPKHYFTYLSTFDIDTIQMYIMLKDKSVEINFKSMRILNISNSEMMIVSIPNLPRARDLRPHFVQADMYKYAPIPKSMSIIEKSIDSVNTIYKVDTKLVTNFSLTCFGNIMITLPDAISYDWGGAGRCMSILLCDTGKIRGFHIAGNGTKKGYAQIVTMDVLNELGDTQQPPDLPFVDPTGVPATQIESNVEVLGAAQAAFKINLPNETSIRESEIHGVFPVRTIPAPLRPCKANNYTKPLELGIHKHGLPPLGFDAYHMDVAEERLTTLLLSCVKPVWANVQVRSQDLAIRGVESTPGFKSLVLSTSEGFPYMCRRPAGGFNKRWLICAHDTEYALHPSLVQEYEKNMQLRRENKIPPTVFVDCLKDARLPIEKALTPGKVRIFSVAPTDFVIAFRQYFADFIVAFTKARFNMFHAIGIAPEKEDWTELVRHLTEVGDKFLCGDYKNFGPGFDHGVHKAVYRAVIKWYDAYSTVPQEQHEIDQRVRKIMHIELSEPIHIAHDIFYKTYSGMCSGSPTTTPDNSLVNFMYILLAWFCIMSTNAPRMAPLDVMLKHVRIVTYGDDIIMCVSDEVVDLFNNVTLHQFFKKYNIEYTDALKTGDIRPYCNLAEATFLKRSFVPHPYHRGTFLGALEKISVEDCANWINKTVDIRSASLEASYACLQLAYGHGPKYFNWVKNKLILAWREKGVLFTPRSWDDFELMYRGCDKIMASMYIGEGQGPPTSTPGENTECEESKDTVIQDHAPPDVVCPPTINQHIIDWAGADYDANYERLINRYILVDTYPWRKSDLRDSHLKKKVNNVDKESVWILPLDAIKNNKNTPTVLPFLQHRYANFDMEIKIVANVNKFMVGQLQASWYYAHKEDFGYKYRNHVFSRSQLIHAVIDAGSSNSASLCVPFKSFRPWINTGNDDALGEGLNLGQLVLKVLSQLTIPSTVYSECSVSIYVKFTKGNFMGVIPRDLNTVTAEGEMLPMLTTMAAGYLMQQMADKNRDKPPVQLPPTHMQPMASSSLAVGTGCSEPLQALRLDSRGQCPHPDSGDSDMDLLNIARRSGLLTTITWKDSHNSGSKLWDIEVTPTPDRAIFQTVQLRPGSGSESAINGYCVPPISVISGLMSEWRGSIDFEFHVIGSQYHTGRLLCCFIPAQVDSLTLEQAQALPYVVYDIHDERTFMFTTPYIADKPWWPCGYLNGQKIEPPGIGKIFLLVLNPLIPMDNVAKDLEILIYIKASPTFEIAVPRQSVWGLPWNIDTKAPDSVYARDGYYPWYADSWRYVNGGKSYCLRYGPVSDHVAQFNGLKLGATGVNGHWASYYLDKTDANYVVNSSIAIGNTTLGDCDFIPIDVNDGYGLIYLGVIKSTEVRIGAGAIFPKNYDGKVQPNYTKLMAISEATGYVSGNPKLAKRNTPNTPTVIALSSDECSGEGNIQICEPSPAVKSTNCGMDLFGESYNDGKDYLRRYEPLFRVSIPPPSNRQDIEGDFHLAMDVLPAGYQVPLNNPYSQTSRDGGQAIVASGFRFFRGSMNFKLIANHSAVNIIVEHRPDRRYSSSMFRPAGLTPRDSKWTKNYAQCLLSASVNKITTINVPFYQMGTLGLLQNPNPAANEYALRAYSLGELLIGVEYDDVDPKKQNTTIDIFRAIGDDMRFYTYTGFPCLVYIGDLVK